MKQVLFLIIILFAVSCGVQKQLQKSYVGKPLSIVEEEFGKPKAVLEQNDDKVYVYEKTEELKSTEISQGKLTLDPMISPMVKKTERYYFTVKDGKIIKVKLEEEYER